MKQIFSTQYFLYHTGKICPDCMVPIHNDGMLLIVIILTEFAGAAMFAPMINPYEPSMTKEEMRKTWDQWSRGRKLMYFLARRFPKFLSSIYCRTFLSGNHGRIDKWMSQSLGRKVSFSISLVALLMIKAFPNFSICISKLG